MKELILGGSAVGSSVERIASVIEAGCADQSLVDDSLLSIAAKPASEEVDRVELQVAIEPGPEEDSTPLGIVGALQDDHSFEEVREHFFAIGCRKIAVSRDSVDHATTEGLDIVHDAVCWLTVATERPRRRSRLRDSPGAEKDAGQSSSSGARTLPDAFAPDSRAYRVRPGAGARTGAHRVRPR